MTETGDTKSSLMVLDQQYLWDRLRDAFNSGYGSVRALVIEDHGRELVVDYKKIVNSSL